MKRIILYCLLFIGTAFILGSCTKPAWKNDPELRKSLQTRLNDRDGLNALFKTGTIENRSVFEKLNIPYFVEDFKENIDVRKQKGKYDFWAFLDIYVSMHTGSCQIKQSYSSSMTGLFMWLLVIFLFVLLSRLLDIKRYRKDLR